MDALTALLRHIKLEPLVGTGNATQAAKPLTDMPVPAPGPSAAAEGHADASLPSPEGKSATIASAQQRIAHARLSSGVEQTFVEASENENASAFARLSPNASALARTIQSAQKSDAPMPMPMPLDVASEIPAQVAQRLNTSLEQSGLFYESHLQQWASGARSLSSLHAEPHNRLSNPGENTFVRVASAGSESTAGSTRTTMDTATPSAPSALALPEMLQPVVREQLDALDLQRIVWQGEVWPQQKAQLEIRPEQQRQDTQQEETDVRWQSTLHIDLPGLGRIMAHILLAEDGAQVTMRATPEAINVLKQGSDEFRQAMDAAGIALRRLDLSDEAGEETHV